MIIRCKEGFMKSKYALFILLSEFIIISSLFSSVATTTNCLEAFKFIVFQIGGMLIPGLAIFELFPIKCKTKEEELILAYIDGYILSMAMYLIVMICNLDKYATFLYFIIDIISIFIIVKKYKVEDVISDNKEIDIVPWIFLAVLLIVSWIVFSMHWDVSIYTTEFSDDGLFWIGDLISLDKKFLPMEFRLLEPGRKYHYGGAMQLAMVCKVTNISAFNLAAHYSYIQSMIILTFSAYCVVKRLVKVKKVVWVTLFLLFFSTGMENRSVVTYMWHVFIQPMSFNIALSLELIIILLMLLQIDEKKIQGSILYRMTLVMLVCTITKGPSGAIAVCAVGVICIWWLIKRKEIKKSILYGMHSLVAFGLVYLFLADMNSVYALGDIAVNEVTVTEQVAYETISIYERINKIILPLGEYIKYVFYVNPWTFIPAVIYFAYVVIKKKAELVHWIFGTVLLVGTILGYTIDYVGKSQMYFTLAVYPFAALMTGLVLSQISLHESWLNKQTEFIKIALSVVGCSGIFMFSIMGSSREFIEQAVYIGTANLFRENYESLQGEYAYDKMVYAEYEAYEWIRLNTEENALFLSDRALEDDIESRIPGVFCERYIYKFWDEEDFENARQCFAGNERFIIEYADEGVRYIIQNRRISPHFSCSETIATKIYENQQVVVYELQDSNKWKQL